MLIVFHKYGAKHGEAQELRLSKTAVGKSNNYILFCLHFTECSGCFGVGFVLYLRIIDCFIAELERLIGVLCGAV